MEGKCTERISIGILAGTTVEKGAVGGSSWRGQGAQLLCSERTTHEQPWGTRGTLSSKCSAGIIPLLKESNFPRTKVGSPLSLAVGGRERLHHRKLLWLGRKVLIEKLSFALGPMWLEGSVILWMDVS